MADSQGFLRQWGDVAKARNVQRLYIGEASAEAVAAQMPDLILISATGVILPSPFTISFLPLPQRWSSITTIKAGSSCSRSWAKSPGMKSKPPQELPVLTSN